MNETAAVVFGAVDGHRNVDDLVDVVSEGSGEKVDNAVVVAALSELSIAGLVDADGAVPLDLSRRRAIGRVAAVGAGAVAVPVIKSIIAPSVAAAQSGGGGGPGGPGGGGPETATVTVSGVETYTDKVPTAFTHQAVSIDFDLDVTSSANTPVTSGTMNLSDTGTYDIYAGYTVSGPVTIDWDDSSTSSGTVTWTIGPYSFFGPPAASDVTLDITSGTFSTSGSSYPQSSDTTRTLVSTPDPYVNSFVVDAPLVLGG